MSQVTTGPEDEPNETSGPATDFDYVTSALAYALVEDLTLEDLEDIITIAKNGKEFDAAVCGTIWLKEVVREHYEAI